MALDAVITKIEDCEEGITIHLIDRDRGVAPAGQSTMVIVNPSVRPIEGDMIWSTGNIVQLESGGITFPYRREGYTRLHQDWNSK